MKFCIDCQHHKIGHRCGNPAFARVSPVDGRAMDSDCAIQRSTYGTDACGPDAAGFEAKPKEEL